MKKEIFNELIKTYKDKMAYAILRGERNPTLRVIISIEEELNIPAKEWLDIKSFISSSENDTKTPAEDSRVAS